TPIQAPIPAPAGQSAAQPMGRVSPPLRPVEQERAKAALDQARPEQPRVRLEIRPSSDSVAAGHELRRMAPALAQSPLSAIRPALEPTERERYAAIDTNPVRRVSEQPVSTFSIDVDTGSYANVRRFLNAGRLPPSDAVRVEELINYFDYADAAPAERERPFAVHMEVGPNPWNANARLVRVGLKAWQLAEAKRPDANLVFLVDVSGSMNSPAKLPLLKRSLRLLTQQLTARDKVTLVVYAGASGVVLEPTPADQRATIDAALEQLSAGGSTNGGAGIRLAYAKAREAFIDGGINRVLIATDGDFNVGTVNHNTLIDLIKTERKHGIALTTLGFGAGNYNDHLMEQLADHGDGNHAYIDTLQEARKVLVDELNATLHRVASDVKIQIEFNPAQVSEYRLVGYENRMLKREDFNNDAVDAGDIGAGHAVTALYEITLAGQGAERIDPLRYGSEALPKAAADKGGELAWLRLRYKPRGVGQSVLLEQGLSVTDMKQSLAETSDDYRFAASVAAFGQRLRDGEYLEGFGYPAIHELAAGARGGDRWGYRGGFLELVRMAAALSGERVALK
ncbi:MAG: vWA domain-containing protein, partial [Gammaproteobacteria bacterium]